MIRLNNTKQKPVIAYNISRSDLEPGRRLIVPVPSPEADLTSVAKRVWELANTTGSQVRFIGLCNDAVQESGFRRALATLTAMVNSGSVSAESEIVYGKNWVAAIRSRLQPGDTLVCWREQRTELLHAELDVPIYFLFQLDHRSETRSTWLTQALLWGGFLAIIVGFFILQVEINRSAQGWATILQLLSIAGEFASVWLWNSLLG